MSPSFPVLIEPEAERHLAAWLGRKGGPGSFVRIGVKGGGCSGLEYVVRIDEVERPGDLVAPLGSVRVLCDPKSAAFLEGATLRYTGDLLSGGLAFDNPNADRSCGCGTSFHPKAGA
jgi:iron-sulfur cluster assembly protein